ncbi:lysozyme [Thalassospira marina]|uniref:Lysozyme n=1 Tax=Thalassospira marina TaxID=2048283 RepID=A0A2N3KV10_9PROT|nr:lysozyme [Thalassospira marina]PKR54392.1 muraminidase [Thalassospira marina]
MRSLDLAISIATRPRFDHIFDPDTSTAVIEPYHDDAGYPTIGFGHLLSRKKWDDLGRYQPITVADANQLLRQDMLRSLAAVRRLIAVPVTDEQEAALIDFAFNCGGANLQASTLRRVINRGEYEAAPAQFMRWVYAGGRKMGGLVARRAAEVDMWAG